MNMKKLVAPLLAVAAGVTLGAVPPSQATVPVGGRGRSRGGGMPDAATIMQQMRISTRPGDPTTVTEVDARLTELRAKIESITDRPYQGPDSVTTPLNEMVTERDKVALTLAAKKAREDAIQQKIDQLTHDARAQIDQDATLEQLRKIAGAKQQEAERLQELAKNKMVGTADVEAAVAAAAEALVRVQERREAILASVGGGALANLNRELITVSLDVSEQTSLLKSYEQRVDQFRYAREFVREYGRIDALRMALVQIAATRAAPPWLNAPSSQP